jgi:hypothetical protein
MDENPARGNSNPCQVWLTNPENLLFLTLIVAHLIPLWAFTYFPSQDGPAHLENASIIREYHEPARSAFRAYYVFNQSFTPNWAGHLVLAGLMSLLPPLPAEKVFLSGYVILLPVAVRYALTAVRPDSGFLAVLGFPFVFNYLLHMGFYSFSYSLAMFFFVSGYWLKHRERFGLRETVTLAALSILLFLGHVVSTVTVLLEILLMTGWLLLPDLVRPVWQRRFPRSLSSTTMLLRPLAALVPACFLIALFLVRNQQRHLSWQDRPPLATMIKDLVSLHSLVSYEHREVWVARAVVCLFGGIIAYLLASGRALPALTFWNGLALVALTYALIYLLGPSAVSSGSYISERMNLYPFLALIIWFGAHSYGPMARRGIQVVTVGLTCVLLGLHGVKYRELNSYLAEYLSGSSAIESNATLLPIVFSPRGDAPDPRPLSLRIDVLLNAAGYIATKRHIVNLGNYEASQTPFFPVLFRPGLNPAVPLAYAPVDSAAGEVTAVPTGILSYPRHTGGSIDYVLVWGVQTRHHGRAVPETIFRQLQQGYDLVYTSPARGLAQLYRRKDRPLAPRPPQPSSLAQVATERRARESNSRARNYSSP